MSEFDLEDLKKIGKSSEIIDYLIEKDIIKESKFRKQLEYEQKLHRFQHEMVRLQQFIIENNKRLLIIFEGRDAAGKGGTIKRFTSYINPKRYRVTALSKPSEIEQKEWYFQRYIKHLPHETEMVFFDRSWYNRAVVEPVFGFCTESQHESFMKQVVDLERLLIDDGIILIKFFLNISKDEQKERLDKRAEDPLKRWKIGGLDKQAQEKWDDYSFYFDKMLKQTSTKQSPWIEVKTDSKKDARLNCMSYVLDNIKGFKSKKIMDWDNDIIKIHK